MIKTKFLACAALLAGATSCLGPNHAFNGIHNWNATVTEYDWANEVIYLGLNIIPVYGVAHLGDILIFNTMHYWTGENPIDAPGPFPTDKFTSK